MSDCYRTMPDPPPVVLTPEQKIATDYIQRQRSAKLPILIPVLMELTGWSHSAAAKFVQKAITETPQITSDSVKMPAKAARHCQEMNLPERREFVSLGE